MILVVTPGLSSGKLAFRVRYRPSEPPLPSEIKVSFLFAKFFKNKMVSKCRTLMSVTIATVLFEDYFYFVPSIYVTVKVQIIIISAQRGIHNKVKLMRRSGDEEPSRRRHQPPALDNFYDFSMKIMHFSKKAHLGLNSCFKTYSDDSWNLWISK